MIARRTLEKERTMNRPLLTFVATAIAALMFGATVVVCA
jgi:hypothetical protein